MKKRFLLISCIAAASLSLSSVSAQTDSAAVEPPPFDFSQFAGDAVEVTEGSKKEYCSSKIFGLSPAKLISLGYDYQTDYKIENDFNKKSVNTHSTKGLRFLANFPVISRNDIIVNVGTTYMETHYGITADGGNLNGLTSTLKENSLRSMGVNFTVFKPLNKVNFLLFNTSHDLNGDYKLSKLQPMKYMKHSVLGVYGWKKHDRLQMGVGVSRTYRGGRVLHIPIIMYNYTAPNRKWGIESVFPARVSYRRSFSPRSILLAGYELEGASYRLGGYEKTLPDIELRRSELRFKLAYEFSVHQFIWLSAQAGLRANYRFNVDDGDKKDIIKNTLESSPFFNLSLNLVSP
jgi:hypothetical protein